MPASEVTTKLRHGGCFAGSQQWEVRYVLTLQCKIQSSSGTVDEECKAVIGLIEGQLLAPHPSKTKGHKSVIQTWPVRHLCAQDVNLHGVKPREQESSNPFWSRLTAVRGTSASGPLTLSPDWLSCCDAGSVAVLLSAS